MSKIDIRIDKPSLQFQYEDLKVGEAFWCDDGLLNIKCKPVTSGRSHTNRATVLGDGTIWNPDSKENVRPASVAIIEI